MDPFSDGFKAELNRLMAWRRDVRRFTTQPVDEAALARGLDAFARSPSVGLSEPWRVIRVSSDDARNAAFENFKTANADALSGYNGEQAEKYAGLKLSGMREAPVQLAIFCDDATAKGHGLGAGTMPEMRRYSVVCAIMQMWLALAAEGVGLGWVSILDPDRLANDLDVPEPWKLVAYLCIGYPEEHSEQPELEKAGGEERFVTLNVQDK